MASDRRKLLIQPVDRGERFGEPRAVESRVVVRGEAEQFVFGVPAAGEDGGRIHEIPHLGSAKKSAYLVRHRVIRVEDRPDRQADWLVLPPIHSQLDFRDLLARPHAQPRERRSAHFYVCIRSYTLVSLNNRPYRLREVELGPRRSENVHIGRHSVQEPVRLNRVPAC
jgi:hypothetical protein